MPGRQYQRSPWRLSNAFFLGDRLRHGERFYEAIGCAGIEAVYTTSICVQCGRDELRDRFVGGAHRRQKLQPVGIRQPRPMQ